MASAAACISSIQLRVAEGFRPWRFLNTDNAYLLYKGSQLALMSADGGSRPGGISFRTAVRGSGGDDSTITVMTRSAAPLLRTTQQKNYGCGHPCPTCIRAVAKRWRERYVYLRLGCQKFIRWRQHRDYKPKGHLWLLRQKTCIRRPRVQCARVPTATTNRCWCAFAPTWRGTVAPV